MKNLFFVWLCCVATTLLAQQDPATPLTIADELNVNYTTSQPYHNLVKAGVVFEQTFYNKNSMYIKLYFEDFDLAPEDYVEISTHNTGEAIIYAGGGKIIDSKGTTISDFWSQALLDDKITVRLHSKKHSNHRGFKISKVAYGYSKVRIDALLQQKSTCGSDDKQNIWCFNGTTFYERGEAVCKIIIGGSGACTGWLLGSEGHVMTNNHCISTTTSANNSDYIFDYQKHVCTGLSLRAGTVVSSSSTLIKTNAALDYTLLQLPTNPTSTYGFLQLSPEVPTVGDPIYIVGHPQGKRKRISIDSDQDPGGTALVNSSSGSLVEYFADTRRGSSGSPVLSQNTHFVLAIHNRGGCPNKSEGRSDRLITDIGTDMPKDGVGQSVSSLPHTESFEGSTAWYNPDNSDFDWQTNSGSTPSSQTGPSAATDGNNYMYMEASGANHPSQLAQLYSPRFYLENSLNNAAVSFQYHMWGNDIGILSFQVSTNGGNNWSTLWIRGGDQGNQWQTAVVDISGSINTPGVQYRFSGITGNSFRGDIAIDDVIVTEHFPTSSCTATFPYEQSFELSYGGWVQSQSDDFNWIFGGGNTPSSNTGPSSANSGSFYLYTESSSPNTNGKKAALVSPCFDLSNLPNPQVKFYSHMYGSSMGSLQLEVSTDDGISWTSIWSRSGNKGDVWRQQTISLSSYTNEENLRFRFVGTTGSSYTSDMAIDNFRVQIAPFIFFPPLPVAPPTNTTTKLEAAPYLEVAPSPFTNTLTINTNLQGNTQYRVVNLQGQTVKEGNLNSNTIALEQLTSGIYFITLYNEKEQLTHKIIRR